MGSPGSLLVKKQDEKQHEANPLLAFLPMVTFDPVGNPLGLLHEQQRRMFFDTLFRNMHSQRASEQQRAHSIVSSAASAPLSAKEQPKASSLKITPLQKSQRAAIPQAGAEQRKEIRLPTIIYPHSHEAAQAQEKLAFEIEDYARGDQQKAHAALTEFESRLRSHGYKTDDIMAVMLLVIEDQIWEGEEGKPGGAQSGGMGMKVQRLVPTKLREAAKDSAEARLASVREMLRYYFQTHPKDYALALASALSLTADQEEDTEFLQERLASELARIGGFAFAQKLLAELKRKKKMDTKKCLRELGYRYNVKEKKLILGKRTCGKQAEAKGIVGLLLASMRKGGDDE